MGTKKISSPAPSPFEPTHIAMSIMVLRGHKVLLDSSIAALYGVPTKALVQAVKPNAERFPADFMFQLANQDLAILRSQIVTSSWGGRRTAPYAFTEQGVAMLSSVLNSPRAIAAILAHIRQIMAPNETKRRPIGFVTPKEK